MQYKPKKGVRTMQVELIKTLKKEKNITNTQIAEKTGLHESTISRILARQTEPKFEDVVLIALAVGASLDALAGFAREESEEVKELRSMIAEKDNQIAVYEMIVSSYDKLLAEKDGGSAYLKRVIKWLAIATAALGAILVCDLFALLFGL